MSHPLHPLSPSILNYPKTLLYSLVRKLTKPSMLVSSIKWSFVEIYRYTFVVICWMLFYHCLFLCYIGLDFIWYFIAVYWDLVLHWVFAIIYADMEQQKVICHVIFTDFIVVYLLLTICIHDVLCVDAIISFSNTLKGERTYPIYENFSQTERSSSLTDYGEWERTY